MTRPATALTSVPGTAPKNLLQLLVALGVVTGVALGAAQEARANQVYKACGKKWARKAARLPQEQLAWMLEKRTAETAKDLDGDGRDDRIVLTSTPSFRTCEVAKDWDQKETTIRIEYATGKTKLVHWINPQLVERMAFYPQIGRILVSGVDAAGAASGKWVEIGRPRETPRETLVAELAAGEKTAPPAGTVK